MEQQIVHVDGHADEGIYFKQLKVRLQHLRSSARTVLNAIKNDYESAKKAIVNLRSRSELKAYVQGKRKSAPTVVSKMAAKASPRNKATTTKSTR